MLKPLQMAPVDSSLPNRPTYRSSDRMWSRSAHGIFAGVCKGLAERFEIDVTLVRLTWVLTVLFFGVGIGAYILCAFSLPREDRLTHAYDSRIFGVASRFARRFDLDIGLTRLFFLFLLFGTGGLMLIAYIAMYFILPSDDEFRTGRSTRTGTSTGHYF